MSPKPLISVLMPTRGRPLLAGTVVDCVNRFRVSDVAVEILLKIDIDDKTYDTVSWPDNCRVLRTPRFRGYWDLHLAWNDLCNSAEGRYLFMIGDDAELLTPGWDSILLSQMDLGDSAISLGYTCYYHGRIETTMWLPSVIPECGRKFLGPFNTYQVDDALNEVFRIYPSLIKRLPIYFMHNRCDLVSPGSRGDKTWEEGPLGGRYPDDFSSIVSTLNYWIESRRLCLSEYLSSEANVVED